MRVASLTDETPAPAVAATPASGGGWVVQVASQRSQNDASTTYQNLQKRFSSIFGGMKPSIRQADLGAKGTFYRIRVGSWASREEATAFCVKLKAAGGDCVVTRN
jgi:cell division protein FtsN